MPEIDRKGKDLIISGIQGIESPVNIGIESLDGQRILQEIADKFGKPVIAVLEELEKRTIEY
jgi:hypothetical protein